MFIFIYVHMYSFWLKQFRIKSNFVPIESFEKMVCGCKEEGCRTCERERSPRGAATDVGDDMKVVNEVGGLAALVEKRSIQQQKLVDESNKTLLGQVEESSHKMLGEFLDEAEKKADARVLASEIKIRKGFASMSNGPQNEYKKLMEKVEGIKKKEGKSTDKNLTEIRKEIENGRKEMNKMESTIGEYMAVKLSASKCKGGSKGYKETFIVSKVKVIGFATDTYKDPAEKTLHEHCASVEGFVEAY